MDARDDGADQAIDHRPSHARLDEGGEIGAVPPDIRREAAILLRPLRALVPEDRRDCGQARVGGDAHEGARREGVERPGGAPGRIERRQEEGGAPALGSDDLEPELSGHRRYGAPARGEGLRADVDPRSRDLEGGDLTAEVAARFEDHGAQARPRELPGGGESGDPAADDDRVETPVG